MFRLSRIVGVAILSLLTLAAALGGPAGCLAQQARDTVGVESLQLACEGVVADARGGVPALPETERPQATASIDAFEAAIATGDRAVIASDAWPAWPSVRAVAEKGIAARLGSGAIGPNVAMSLVERLDRFGDLIGKTVALPP
jgi:hypothetical protein